MFIMFTIDNKAWIKGVMGSHCRIWGRDGRRLKRDFNYRGPTKQTGLLSHRYIFYRFRYFGGGYSINERLDEWTYYYSSQQKTDHVKGAFPVITWMLHSVMAQRLRRAQGLSYKECSSYQPLSRLNGSSINVIPTNLKSILLTLSEVVCEVPGWGSR